MLKSLGHFRTLLPNIRLLATCGCLSLNGIKIKKLNPSIVLATFQVLSSHIRLEATILGISDIKISFIAESTIGHTAFECKILVG